VTQVLQGLQHLPSVVPVQVHAAQHVELGVHPVQPALDQVWREGTGGKKTEGAEDGYWRDDIQLEIDQQQQQAGTNQCLTEVWELEERTDRLTSRAVLN